MAEARVLAYAWKVESGKDAFSNEEASLQALQYILDQVRTLPPNAVLAKPVAVIDDGEAVDNDGKDIYVYHWEVTYAI